MMDHRRWLTFWAAAAVALAFADASIVVLALPQIVDRLHTSIPHVVWVIAAYNLALIVGSVGVAIWGARLAFAHALIGGLVVFGIASIGSAVSNSLSVLVGFRVLQGLGGALLLCGSLPFLATATGAEDLPLGRWAAAAAIGAALGPAAGGLLTQIFDWRAIFVAQTPVALLGAFAAWRARADTPANFTPPAGAGPGPEDPAPDRADPQLGPVTANLALGFLSAGLIGALFLVTVLLINVWSLTPLTAAFVLLAIPLTTFLAERFSRDRSGLRFGAAGAGALAVGLVVLGSVTHKQVAVAVVALVLCGLGLGLAFPSLTTAALRGAGRPLSRVARTIAARDAGLVIGLLVLTPVFVNRLNAAQTTAIAPITKAVLSAPVSQVQQVELGAGLLAANRDAPQSQLPDIGPAFTNVERASAPPQRATLAHLEQRVQSLIVSAATGSFRRPLFLCAVFALLVFPVLGFVLLIRRRSQLVSWGMGSRGGQPAP